ncbi:hypothetical protein H5410_000241 [Solanum commersonii]|uniref:Uncharacterized protein n=1 Tax=Solanum commersonii TaxID=4109 RepID=A0A9J6AVQ4_SOLCO|nr:hypothetical protein H5410_000241 [Solanum commersonii]
MTITSNCFLDLAVKLYCLDISPPLMFTSSLTGSWTLSDTRSHKKRYFRERMSTTEVAIHTNLFMDGSICFDWNWKFQNRWLVYHNNQTSFFFF